MKIKQGWIMVKDSFTNKMIPFFLKVRSEDVVSTDTIKIDKVLQHTSLKWSEELVSDTIDSTVYKFTRNFSGSTGELDENGELSTACVENGVLYYHMFKDGRAHIEGEVQISNQGRDGNGDTESSIKIIDLPYAIKKSFLNSSEWNDAYKVDGDEYTNGPTNPIKISRVDGISSSCLGAFISDATVSATILENGMKLFRLNIVDYFNKEIEHGLTNFMATYLQSYAVDMGIVDKDETDEVTPQELYNATRYRISIDFHWNSDDNTV